jgi:hypothetical protein
LATSEKRREEKRREEKRRVCSSRVTLLIIINYNLYNLFCKPCNHVPLVGSDRWLCVKNKNSIVKCA